MKKCIAIILVTLIFLSLTACGNKNVEKTDEGTIYYLGGEVDKSIFNSPENTLDVEKIYNTIEYTEKMFYGRYWLNDFFEDVKKFSGTAQFAELEYWFPYGDGELKKENLSTLPVKVEAGVPNLYSYKIKIDRNYEWVYLTFARENGTYVDVLCSYAVKDDKLIFTPVDYYEEIVEDNKVVDIKYEIGKDSLEYTFNLRGPNFTLSRGDDSVTLRSFYFSDNTNMMSLDGYKSQESAALGEIDIILGSEIAVYLNDTNGDLMYHPTMKPAIKYTDNGVLTLFWAEKDENDNDIKHVRQFVCFGAGNTMTLVDNDNIYYYTESYFSRELLKLTDGMSSEEIVKAGELSESDLKEIAEKKTNLLDDLVKEFSEKGLNVSINRETGEIALDSTVLFGVNESEISADGKAFLQKFMGVYTSVVFDQKYEGFISKIMVEGHTDTNGSYELNKNLSEARANSVKDYCLSADCGVDSVYAGSLQTMLEAIGYSYDKPIYKENGEVDMDASRRVSFRFIINLGE